jgi:hypothetical protein
MQKKFKLLFFLLLLFLIASIIINIYYYLEFSGKNPIAEKDINICDGLPTNECLAVYTPYLALGFNLTNGGELFEARTDLNGNSNYSSNMVYSVFTARDFSSMPYDITMKSNKANYSIISDDFENVSINILSEGDGFIWNWIVEVSKIKPVFKILYNLSTPNGVSRRAKGNIHQAVVLNYSNKQSILTIGKGIEQFVLPLTEKHCYGKLDWIDVSNIIPNESIGVGIIVSGGGNRYCCWYTRGQEPMKPTFSFNPFSYGVQKYSSDWNYRAATTFYFHGDYLEDKNYTNDWNYTADFYLSRIDSSNDDKLLVYGSIILGLIVILVILYFLRDKVPFIKISKKNHRK